LKKELKISSKPENPENPELLPKLTLLQLKP